MVDEGLDGIVEKIAKRTEDEKVVVAKQASISGALNLAVYEAIKKVYDTLSAKHSTWFKLDAPDKGSVCGVVLTPEGAQNLDFKSNNQWADRVFVLTYCERGELQVTLWGHQVAYRYAETSEVQNIVYRVLAEFNKIGRRVAGLE